MVAYQKFNQFTKDLIDHVHDFNLHVFKVALSNTAPVASNSLLSHIIQIAGGGYAVQTTAITTSTVSGIAKATAADVTFTASGGSMGPFQYVVVYNDTPVSPLDPLICFFDNGTPLTIADGNAYLADFHITNGLFTIT